MNLIEAIERAIDLGLSNQSVFEGRLSGEFLNSVGKNLDNKKEYICLIDMGKRKITVLGENPN